MPDPCHFVLNDSLIETHESGGLALLDFVRGRSLRGTKEGCKEGDCGACTVLVGELRDPSDEAGSDIDYQPITSCLMPLAEAHGKHVVTIEGLDLGKPNTVQDALLEQGASQCGFCTPGIAVSLTGALMEPEADLGDSGVRRALSGHLCRCTGYRSLKDAASQAFSKLDGATGVRALVAKGEIPAYFEDVPERLRALPPVDLGPADERAIIAGGTDLYVQRGEELPDEPVVALNLRRELRYVGFSDGTIHLGALTTFEDLTQHPELMARMPRLGEFMDLIASWQIRNRSTLGGNLINASPIGDMTIFLLALGGVCVFEDAGGKRREQPLRELYLGYKQLAREPGEVLVEIKVPDFETGDEADFEKVSKRRWLDIATVNSAARVRVREGVIEDAGLAVGGVAPVPLFLRETSRRMIGSRPDLALAREVLATAQEEISPISDVRGSADYKRLLTRQLLIAHLTRLFPEHLTPEDLYR